MCPCIAVFGALATMLHTSACIHQVIHHTRSPLEFHNWNFTPGISPLAFHFWHFTLLHQLDLSDCLLTSDSLNTLIQVGQVHSAQCTVCTLCTLHSVLVQCTLDSSGPYGEHLSQDRPDEGKQHQRKHGLSTQHTSPVVL